MSPLMWIGLVVVLIVLYGISVYNKFVSLQTQVQNATSDVDVQLKRRSDLVPNLVETVKGYANFESGTLEKVVQARNQYVSATSFADKAAADNQLAGALRQLFALSESYPDLKANASFLDLQTQLSALEDTIQNARRYYNATVREYTILTKSFPSNIVANIFGFGKEHFFEITEAERVVPKVTF
ncbi:MAG: LemA family protein [Candidatus Absconditabacterales bacterium]